MHYKNGRPARNGDIILSLMNPQAPVVGVLFGAKREGGNDCNGLIAPITPSTQWPTCADLKNCLHIDDIIAAEIPAPLTLPFDPTLDTIGKPIHEKAETEATQPEPTPPPTAA